MRESRKGSKLKPKKIRKMMKKKTDVSYLLHSTLEALVLFNWFWCLTVPANRTPGNRTHIHLLSHVRAVKQKNSCREDKHKHHMTGSPQR